VLAVVLPQRLLAMVLALAPQAPQCLLAMVLVLAPEALQVMLLSKKLVLLVPEEALVQVVTSVQLVHVPSC